MTPLALVITGGPASGKTTIGKRLAREMGLPFLSKDMLKETLFDTVGWSDREWSRKLGAASMRLLYRCAEALLEVDHSVVIESNFYPDFDTPPMLELQRQTGCRFAQVLCEAPGPMLVERFRSRELSGERHPGHAGQASLEEIEQIILRGPWPALPIDGELIRVDTTDFEAIDYAGIVRRLSSRRPEGSESRR